MKKKTEGFIKSPWILVKNMDKKVIARIKFEIEFLKEGYEIEPSLKITKK